MEVVVAGNEASDRCVAAWCCAAGAWLAVLSLWAFAHRAMAQEQPPPPGTSRGENFSAKPPAQLFATDCTGAGCHKGPQGLGQGPGPGGLAGFLREHYTNSRESAAALADYLLEAAERAGAARGAHAAVRQARGGGAAPRGRAAGRSDGAAASASLRRTKRERRARRRPANAARAGAAGDAPRPPAAEPRAGGRAADAALPPSRRRAADRRPAAVSRRAARPARSPAPTAAAAPLPAPEPRTARACRLRRRRSSSTSSTERRPSGFRRLLLGVARRRRLVLGLGIAGARLEEGFRRGLARPRLRPRRRRLRGGR